MKNKSYALHPSATPLYSSVLNLDKANNFQVISQEYS